jgi:glycosyltransferase-like protein LARGE
LEPQLILKNLVHLSFKGVYGLLKLTLAKILPDWVDKAIVLDTDVVFATDISKLWNFFR